MLTGRGAELEQDLPFGVWVDALDDHVAWLGPERLERMLGDRVAELARVLPSVSAGGATPAPALQDERYRAHRAVRALLEQLAGRDARRRAARRPAVGRRLLARAGRPPAAPPAARAAARRVRVPRRRAGAGGARRVRGGRPRRPRGRRAARAAVAPTRPTRCSAASCPRACAASCSGSAAATRSTCSSSRAAWRRTRRPPSRRPGSELPPAVAAALGQELAALGAPARLLAQGAAVAGDPAELGLAAAAGDVPEPDVAGALDELVGKRLLSPGALPRRYRFRHPIVRRAAYESGGEGWRLAAHRRAAAALERTGGPLGARAHHLERCAEPGDDGAFAVLAQAGHAAAPNAPAEAARWYAAALRLLPEGDARRLEVLAPLATALASTGQLERALATLLDVLADGAAGAGRAARAAGRRVRGVREPARPPRRRARAARARRSPSCPSATGAAAAMLEAELAADALYDSDFAALAARAAQARATAGALGDPGLRVLTAALDCFAHYGQGRMPERRGGARRRRGDARRDGRRPARRAARGVLLPGVRRAAVRALRRRHPPHRARRGRLARVGAGPVRGADDGRADARARDARAARRGARHGRGRGRGRAPERQPPGALVGARRRGLGGRDHRRRRARRAAPRRRRSRCSAELSDSILTLATHALASLVFLETGDVERCLAEGRRGRRAGVRRDRARPRRVAAGRAGARRADPRASREAAAGGDRAGARAAGGHVAAADGVDGRAGRGAARARRRRAAPGRRSWPRRAPRSPTASAASCTPRACARSPGRRWPSAGDRDAGARAAQARRGGAGRRSARTGCARRRRATCAGSACASPGASAAARPATGLAALSGREREIAELVALGRTNREIAAELFVSEKTVEGHLRNVFVKLEVTARAAVAEAVGRARADDGGVARPAWNSRHGRTVGRCMPMPSPVPRRIAVAVLAALAALALPGCLSIKTQTAFQRAPGVVQLGGVVCASDYDQTAHSACHAGNVAERRRDRLRRAGGARPAARRLPRPGRPGRARQLRVGRRQPRVRPPAGVRRGPAGALPGAGGRALGGLRVDAQDVRPRQR